MTSMTSAIRQLVNLPYELSRTPFVLAQTKLSQLLPETSTPLVVLDRAIAGADTIAGRVLRDATILKRGAARLEKSDTRLTAAGLEAQATELRVQADAAGRDGRRQAASLREEAQEHAESGLHEADRVETQGKQAARTGAQRKAAATKAAAGSKAAAKSAAVKSTRTRAESAARSKKAAASKRAAAEHEDANAAHAQAEESRADADRLDDLAEEKKSD